MIQWNRSNTLALASTKCATCHGIGTRNEGLPCKCVLRAIFRECLNRFREIAEGPASASPKLTGALTFGLVREEYLADFCLLAKRTLTPEEHQIHRYYHMLGADWKLCTRRLGIDKGNFYHAVYRIEEKLGRAFAETVPYGLYPLDEYFGGTVRTTQVTPVEPPPAKAQPLVPPMLHVDAVAQPVDEADFDVIAWPVDFPQAA